MNWLEIYNPGPAQRSVFLLPNVQQSEHTLPGAVQIEWTLGTKPKRYHAGVRSQTFTLSGTSGHKHRLGYDKKGRRLYADGPTLFIEFRGFIERYLEAAKVSTDVVLIYRSVKSQQDLLVEPLQFQSRRTASTSRFTFEWTLTLESYGKTSKRPKSIFDKIGDVIKSITKAIDTISGYVALADEYVQTANGVLQQMREPVMAVGRVTRQLESLGLSVASITSFPADLLNEIYNVAEDSVNAIQNVWNSLPGTEGRDWFENAMMSIGEVRRASLEALGYSRTSVVSTSAAGDKVVSMSGALLHQYTVQDGDTWQSIAQKTVGIEKWTETARLNGASSSEMTAYGSPLIPGLKVLVPITPGIEVIEADVMGEDFLLKNGDLVWTGKNVAISRGRANLAQAITLRMTAKKGVRPYWPDYGLQTEVGEKNTAQLLGLFVSDVRGQLLSDPRISDITSLEVEDQANAFITKCVVSPVAGKEIQIKI